MIANLITIMRRSAKAAIQPIVNVWNLIETLWEAKDTNWEDE